MMAIIGMVPRRCVNLPPGSLRTLILRILTNRVREGPAREEFPKRFGRWLGVPHVFGASTGRSAFQLALEALDMEKGREIIFPAVTFPVMPMVAKMLGYRPVFCGVDRETFNAGPDHVAAKMTDNTGAVLATHLFGQPCPIRELADLARSRKIRLLEDCAHACGVRVDGQQVGTFGDIGVFSFAVGKNMPCFGGGAIATADDAVAGRARALLREAPIPDTGSLVKQAVSIWIKWFLTRPRVFGLTAYQVLRLKQALGKRLMDSAVGDELLARFAASRPCIAGLSNLQASVGLLQLLHIDAFNEGARRNGDILTETIGDVPGIGVPRSVGGNHVYVYYPLTVDADKRDSLRRFLLRHGVDTKTTDMSDCSQLAAFREEGTGNGNGSRTEATLLEICVYPVLGVRHMRRIGTAIRAWAGL